MPHSPPIRFAPDELDKIRSLIYKETGMRFEENKDYLLESRITQRMEETGAETCRDYYQTLLFDGRREEIQHLIEAITINETYFFRDFPQLQGFADVILQKHLEEKRRANDWDLRVWSAACSTGEEPYTLAIILREVIDDYATWNVSILATDIDRKVLRHARAGLYNDRSVKDVPIVYRDKYFRRTSKGWQVLPPIINDVTFRELNLMDKLGMRMQKRIDFIFCRNVLIYFDDVSRKTVVDLFYDALIPGGFIFLGHSESVGRMTDRFRLERIGGVLCYRK